MDNLQQVRRSLGDPGEVCVYLVQTVMGIIDHIGYGLLRCGDHVDRVLDGSDVSNGCSDFLLNSNQSVGKDEQLNTSPKSIAEMAESEESIASIGRARLNAILGDSLFRDSSVLIAATLVGGGLNYAYQVLMGRLLGPEQYGVFGSLFGLFYMIMILSIGVV